MLVLALMAGSAFASPPQIEKAIAGPVLQLLPMSVSGRVVHEGSEYRYQWPGTYFEADFDGTEVYFTLKQGDGPFHILIDDIALAPLIKPDAGIYRIGHLGAGAHHIRLEWVGERQWGPQIFGGFAVSGSSKASAQPQAKRAHQIEFIGDSHTVGYGNTSDKHECSGDEVSSTTDNSQAFGALTARHYDADYQINAISGRGIIRNFNGSDGDALPLAYPYSLFDKQKLYEDSGWKPRIIVIDLGTNDFSTPLNAGEKWKSRDELHADYEATYVRFVQSLHARHPDAFIILMNAEGGDGEVAAEARKVAEQLKAAGLDKIAFLPLPPLSLTACHWHPSLNDDTLISQTLIKFIDGNSAIWGGK